MLPINAIWIDRIFNADLTVYLLRNSSTAIVSSARSNATAQYKCTYGPIVQSKEAALFSFSAVGYLYCFFLHEQMIQHFKHDSFMIAVDFMKFQSEVYTERACRVSCFSSSEQPTRLGSANVSFVWRIYSFPQRFSGGLTLCANASRPVSSNNRNTKVKVFSSKIERKRAMYSVLSESGLRNYFKL